MRTLRLIGTWILIITGIFVIFVIGVMVRVQTKFAENIYRDPARVSAPVAIVFGASVSSQGVASDALHDRVTTGIRLYQQGKVQKLLMTGDNGEHHVDEVSVMKKLAQNAGVPETDILVDIHGYRTYESCDRAAHAFHITQAVLITQRFHLARALYLCESFGIHSQGLTADLQTYQRIIFFTLRDLAASVQAWFDVNVYAPNSIVNWKQV